VSRRRTLVVGALYAALVALGIPWYWPEGEARIVAGVPAWVAVAIVTSVLVSALTAWLLLTAWPDDDD